MVEGCVTDLPLGKEEAGSLRWLGHLEHDHHPDAVACRLKLSLAAAPCPEMSTVLPWDLVEQVFLYPDFAGGGGVEFRKKTLPLSAWFVATGQLMA